MELIALISLIAVLQIVALGASAPGYFQFMRVGMPVLTFGAAAGLYQADAEAVWIAAFVLAGLTFALLPELPAPVWVVINLAVAMQCLAYVGSVVVASVL